MTQQSPPTARPVPNHREPIPLEFVIALIATPFVPLAALIVGILMVRREGTQVFGRILLAGFAVIALVYIVLLLPFLLILFGTPRMG